MNANVGLGCLNECKCRYGMSLRMQMKVWDVFMNVNIGMGCLNECKCTGCLNECKCRYGMNL